jgi:D-apionate oxidoisomerase
MSSMAGIALLGAAGKMGLRLTANLKESPYDVRHVEVTERGRALLIERGIEPVALEQALDGADVVILAIPDNRIGPVLTGMAPRLAPGTLVVMLDVAAAYAGTLPLRADLSYFITHPCHPSVFSNERDPRAQRDFFGGEYAQQNIVCCLAQGSEESYALGERIARLIYKPVINAHRCTVEQMAILEPVLSETILGTCLSILREATDEAVRRGVPAPAARDFILGHMRTELAIVFEEKEGAVFSDGALKAIERAQTVLFQPDWKRVFEPQAVVESVRQITSPETDS